MPYLWPIFVLVCFSVTDVRGEEESDPASRLGIWTPGTDYLTRCDFNNNSQPFCDWTQICGTSQGTWIRTKHATPTPGTGPDGDYPDGSGYFIYQEASNLVPFDTNTLESPELVVSGEICIDFWYHMFGSEDLNKLNVSVLAEGAEGFTVWSRRGSQSSAWLHGFASVHFPREEHVRVAFEAVRGLTEFGDTALDNVAVRRGPCLPTTMIPDETTTSTHAEALITTIQTAATTPASLPDSSIRCDFSCSFEVDFCSWTQSDTDSFDWTRHKGPTSSTTTGPSYDHTTGEGYFIYLKSNDANPGDVAHLVSPTCTSHGPHCLRFWYHMYGVARAMALRVYVVSDGAAPELVWSQTGNKGNRWNKAEISIAHTGRLQIILEGVRGEDFRSDVAVDDISVTEGYCPGFPNPTTTVTTTTTTTPAPPTLESCVVSGDPHYYTFDKQTHHFMGNCTYTLAQRCGTTSSLLPYFNVEATNEHRWGNTQVSYVKSVDVDVFSIRVTLEKGGTVKVNGKGVDVPSTPAPGVEIFPSGFYTVVSTDFGLRVKFDGDHQVEVTLPSTYKGKVCGLCGNYNDDPADDFLNPRGEREPDSTSLGNSWQVSNHTSCSPGPDPVCTDAVMEAAQSNSFCGLITDPSGPFRHCHSTLDPTGHFTSCVYDQCALSLDPGSLCRNLQSYADACQSHGIRVERWRNATFCPIACAPNSHYEPCANACPGTCVDPTAPATCGLPCTEACVCDSGFLLHSGACVPSHQCGCWERGKHYPVGAEVWTDDTCASKCVCPRRGGRLECLPAHCPKDHYCGVQNGVPGCYPHTYGVCRVHNDPHYNTFDKATHHFMGNCTYTLARVCASSAELTFFNIEAKNEHRGGNPSVSYVQRVLVEVYGQRIEMVKNDRSHVLVNKVLTTLPVHVLNVPHSIHVERNGRYVKLETDFRLSVSYDTDHSVEIRVPTSYFNRTCGMCGNFNDRPQDDHMMPNGEQASSSTQLGNSWQVPDAEYDRPFCGAPGENASRCSPEEEALYGSEAFCGLLTSSQGPLAACLSVINPESFFESCVFDLCALGGSQQLLCSALEAYSDACQRAGADLPSWRNATFCPLACPPNTHYEPCSTGCPATCLQPQAPGNCTQPCVEGCACNSGLVLSGGDCVPVSRCGCLYAGQYYSEGESFVTADCTERCVCQGNSNMVCVDISCSPEEACKVQNGLRGCYPATRATCHVYGDPHYSTFDGRLHHFQGSCNYTLVQTCHSHTTVPFSITARNEHRGSPHWTALNSVAVTLKGLHIALRKGKAVYIDGVLAKPVTIRLPDATIEYVGSYVHVTTNIGVQIKFDGDQDLLVDVTENYQGKVCGLCGIYNGDPQDDFSTPAGVITEDVNAFGNSWRVPDDQWPCNSTVDAPKPCPPSEQQAAMAQCEALLAGDGPFSLCHPAVPPLPYFDSCTYDLCATGGSSAQLCNVLRAYAAACREAGVALGSWEAETVCESCFFNCTFEEDFCEWQQSREDDFDWSRGKHCLQNDVDGIRGNCSSSGHYYIYADSSSTHVGQTGQLMSPECVARGPSCFRFWYRMEGASEEGSLKVYLVQEGEREPLLVWLTAGSNGGTWLQAELDLHLSGRFQILLEGMTGADNQTRLAVDDVSLDPGCCLGEAPTTEETTPSEQSTISQSTTLELQSTLLPETPPVEGSPPPPTDHTDVSSPMAPDSTSLPSSEVTSPGTADLPFTNEITLGQGTSVDPQSTISPPITDWVTTGQETSPEPQPTLSGGTSPSFEAAPTSSPPLTDHTTATSPLPSSPTGSLPSSSVTTSRPPTTTSTLPPLTGRATCSASGDPHYTTFDGRVHHFMGNCTYTLSQVCANSSSLPGAFHVSATNEHRGSNTAVSYVKSVHVEVYGEKVSLLKNRNVNVNDRRSNLPIFIGNNKIVVKSSGSYVFLETDFGLGVRFDGNHYVEVSVLPAYKGQLCGMCGNYNGDPRDDNLKPDGQPAGSSTLLGDSWLVPENFTECSSPQPVCRPELENEIRRDSACTMITDPAGIFKDCHPMVDPANFFENCVLDACLTNGQQTSLCNGLQAYAEACSNVGLCLEWRNTTLCPISCPAGSHYQSCGNRCAPSCVTPSVLSSCSPLPVGGCFCDEGFILSGDRCVPESSCGCVTPQGRYYQLGESWFPEETCSERCTCEHGGAIACTPWECGVLEKCSVQDGVLGCHTSRRASCHVAGDPHYYTFDKVMHTFLGTCTYTLVTICGSNSSVTPVTIIGRNEDRGQRGATYLREVYVDVYGTRVTLQKNKRILFDNERAYAPAERRSQKNSVSVGNVGIYLVVETDFGLVVKYDGNQLLEISLPGTYFSQVCGLCGNYNGLQEDELLMPDGTQAKNVTQFGNSWKVDDDSDASCLPDTRQDLGPPCTAQLRPSVEEQCGVLQSKPFAPCHRLVRPELFIQTCVYDMCKYDGMLSTLCAIVQAYTDACKAEGVIVKWRNSTFCPLPCPPNSYYTDCASPCPPTCNNIYAEDLCEKPPGECLEGCACSEGHVLSDDQCVPLSECGCRDKDDNYYKVGESWVTRHCSQKCRCRSGGIIKCQSFGCEVGEICQLKNNGKYGCKPTGFGKCLVTGDPHYLTFDGLLHHFQGTHTYVLSQSQPGAPPRLEPFSIEGKNKVEAKGSQITFLKELKVAVYNHTVLLRQGKKLVVDGVKAVPPAQPHEGLWIHQRAMRIYLETDFGLSVSFDGAENSDIMLPNTYKKNVEGLCGNFDGKYKNDFTTPDGVLVKDVDTFGESWRVPVQRGTSRLRRNILSEEELDSAELDTGFALRCTPAQLSQASSSSNCGILEDLNGPFGACFDHIPPSSFLMVCLFDMCVEANRTTRLCPLLEQYALACQQEGVALEDWREKAACVPQCPPNSKYSTCMSACPASCSDLAAPAECSGPCLEGCECLSGYVLSGFDCVPFRECGCSFLGRYYQVGESFMTDDCSQVCVCTNSSSVSCSRAACAHGELCTVDSFTRGCYTSGPCLPNPCLNDGVCIEEGSPNGFYCKCSEAYHGNYCEIEAKPKEDHPEDHSQTIIYFTVGVAAVVILLILITAIVLCCCCVPRKRARNSSTRQARSLHPSRVSSAAQRDLVHVSNLAFEQD